MSHGATSHRRHRVCRPRGDVAEIFGSDQLEVERSRDLADDGLIGLHPRSDPLDAATKIERMPDPNLTPARRQV
jgi:hypothetical protein